MKRIVACLAVFAMLLVVNVAQACDSGGGGDGRAMKQLEKERAEVAEAFEGADPWADMPAWEDPNQDNYEVKNWDDTYDKAFMDAELASVGLNENAGKVKINGADRKAAEKIKKDFENLADKLNELNALNANLARLQIMVQSFDDILENLRAQRDHGADVGDAKAAEGFDQGVKVVKSIGPEALMGLAGAALKFATKAVKFGNIAADGAVSIVQGDLIGVVPALPQLVGLVKEMNLLSIAYSNVHRAQAMDKQINAIQVNLAPVKEAIGQIQQKINNLQDAHKETFANAQATISNFQMAKEWGAL